MTGLSLTSGSTTQRPDGRELAGHKLTGGTLKQHPAGQRPVGHPNGNLFWVTDWRFGDWLVDETTIEGMTTDWLLTNRLTH